MKKIKIVLICSLFLLSSLIFTVNVNTLSINFNENNPPNPPVITGPSSGNIKETYTYYITVSDPDEDNLLLRIEINFGDGTTACGGCDGRGPWNSGDVVAFNHSWTRKGTFEITGRVQDEHGAWSNWSDPLPVTMPYAHNLITRFLELLIQQFSIPFLKLQHLLRY